MPSHLADRSRVFQWIAWLILALSLSVSIFSWIWTEQRERQKAHMQFSEHVSGLRNALTYRVSNYQLVLNSAASLFSASEYVTQAEWREYVARLNLAHTDPSFLSLSFATAGHAADAPALDQSGWRILYSEPANKLAAISGDLRLIGPLHWALQAASAQPYPVFSAKFTRDTAPGELADSLLMIAPLVKPRANQQRGVVLLQIQSSRLLQEVLAGVPPGVTYRVYDGVGEHAPVLFAPADNPGYQPLIEKEEIIQVAGRSWRVFFASTPALDDPANSGVPKAIFLLGIAIALGLLLSIRRWDSERQKQLTQQAFHDALTGLPNRYWLSARLQKLGAEPGKTKPFALLFLDGDNFKAINDTEGHELGDKLLIMVAGRLRACTSPSVHISRHGGDEFIVLIEDINSQECGQILAERIINQLKEPFVIDGKAYDFSVSIGVVPSSAAYAGQFDNMFADADIAMYRAKDSGKSSFVVYSSEFRAQSTEAVQLYNDLRRSIKTPAKSGFSLGFQPIVGLANGHLHGFEVLTRWLRPGYGSVPPATFISIAENNGLIGELDLWVMREAGAQLSRWQDGFPDKAEFCLALNVSGQQLAKDSLACDLMQTLSKHHLANNRFKLEITETAIIDDPLRSIEQIKLLSGDGINFAIDDFGTGYSSLGYLRQLPIQFVKIDRSFVMNIESDDKAKMITQAIIALAHSLRLKTIAEGIETEQQHALLKSWGCDFGQGYWFAAALSANDAEAWIRDCPACA